MKTWVTKPNKLSPQEGDSTTSYWVYILMCENNSYYTGYTTNLEKRFQAHLEGRASKYTRSFKPLCMAQSWEIQGSKADAMRVERQIKALSRAEKEKIVLNPMCLSLVL